MGAVLSALRGALARARAGAALEALRPLGFGASHRGQAGPSGRLTVEKGPWSHRALTSQVARAKARREAGRA